MNIKISLFILFELLNTNLSFQSYFKKIIFITYLQFNYIENILISKMSVEI